MYFFLTKRFLCALKQKLSDLRIYCMYLLYIYNNDTIDFIFISLFKFDLSLIQSNSNCDKCIEEASK